jgi:hypothetical protein
MPRIPLYKRGLSVKLEEKTSYNPRLEQEKEDEE